LLIGFVGCAEKSTEISGSVSYAGEPVPEGTIRFEPTDRQSAPFDAAISNGQYRITVPATQVRPTKYVVRVEGLRKTGRQLPAGPPMPEGTFVDEIKPYLPQKYNSQSMLERELSADPKLQLDFALDK
jgi:hypothetical protein